MMYILRLLQVILVNLVPITILKVITFSSPVASFHDCVQSRRKATNRRRRRRRRRLRQTESSSSSSSSSCEGGICVGMTNGPHQNGNASYPIAWNGTTGTRLESYMVVPEYPQNLTTTTKDDDDDDDFKDITYYIWTDIFFGDESYGRMNQLVPQLILGSALDGSTGPPNYKPKWNTVHTKWMFGSHYFFEIWNPDTQKIVSHAAYGKLYNVNPGEILFTKFELVLLSSSSLSSSSLSLSPAWVLTMSVVGDPLRTSVLRIDQPYMGLGARWKDKPSVSWLESNFRNMCINACWELYGATNIGLLPIPANSTTYHLNIQQPRTNNNNNSNSNNNDYYNFTTWEQDGGNGMCPYCQVSEVHTYQTQDVFIQIDVHVDDYDNNYKNATNTTTTTTTGDMNSPTSSEIIEETLKNKNKSQLLFQIKKS